MIKPFSGIIPPIITPINSDEEVDEAGLRSLIDHCIEKGLHGIFVCGTMGESLALRQAERDKAIRIAIEQCQGRVPLMAGVMDSSTYRVIENIKRLEQMGGTVAVVSPICYARHNTQNETIRHFEEISRHTNIELMIYNIPPFTGCNLTADTIFKIAEFDRVIGYKDSGGVLPEFVKCIEHFKQTRFVLLQGIHLLSAPSMLLGADGLVPSAGPILPEVCLGIYNYGRAGDIEKTMHYHRLLEKAQKALNLSTNSISVTKYAMSLLGLTDKRVCRPLEPVKEEECNRIKQAFVEIFEEISAQ